MPEKTKKTRTNKVLSVTRAKNTRGVSFVTGLLGVTFAAGAVASFALPSASYALPFGMAAAVPAQRAVQGRVVDKADTPLTGAVVYLKDTRSLSVKSYLTDDGGRFHFGQLADGADYEVWAEHNGKRSSSKNISQFNSKLDIQFTLKIDLSE